MRNKFVLFDACRSMASLYINSNEHDDGAGIALTALQQDINMVSGVLPSLTDNPACLSPMSVIAGTIGKCPVISQMIADNKLDIKPVQGKRESYIIEVVENPYENVGLALVIAGSDKRGTIYGIYEISKMIGVSPWVWWGDSVPDRKDRIAFPGGLRIVQGEPSVKYRGFFLNDEAPSLSGWLTKHFPKVANPQATQGCGSGFYTKVFELLLRLKGNYLWPVMWNNSFHTDDPQNTVLADKYGVVMGTSHHEHMTCADKEWNWANLGAWNYATNRDNIYSFWKKGTEARKRRESIITLGMRGQLDTSILGPDATLKDNMELMQRVLTDQREIIEDVHGKADAVPQMLALYKEVEAFYYGDDASGKLDVPEDVTLMLCDDNHGNLRTLPTAEMLKRSGGFGMYYHLDYRGGPISYEWINQTPLPKIWDNMTRAYEAGIRDIWIVNVGDLKPMEFPLEYFMALAYDFDTWSKPNKTEEFTLQWARREFGQSNAEAAAEVINGYTKILGARKAEVVHSDPPTFSPTAFLEASRVLESFIAVVAKGEAVYDNLPEHKKAAFYQMVLYQARAAKNVYKTHICAAWSLHYAKLADPLANEYARMAREAFEKDAEDMEYYNKTLSGGKWDGIMRQNHMRYTAWDGPKTHVVPDVMPEVGEVLPGAQNALDTSGGADSSAGYSAPIAVPIPDAPDGTYVETHGFVSMNPSGFISNTESADGAWVVIDDYGREFDSVRAVGRKSKDARCGHHTASCPVSCAVCGYAPFKEYCFEITNASPVLEYSFFLYTEGDYTVNIFIAPSNNPYHPTVKPFSEQLRFSVQMDDGGIETVSCIPEEFDVGYGGAWAFGVMNNARVIAIPCGFLHEGLHCLRVYAVDPGVVIQKIIIAPPDAKQTVITHMPPTEHFMGSYFGPPESFRKL